MVTKQQAMTATEFHAGQCVRHIGKRGGIREHITTWRRNGNPRTWATMPDRFSVPVKYGQWEYGYVTNDNASDFHIPADCPLNDPSYATTDARSK